MHVHTYLNMNGSLLKDARLTGAAQVQSAGTHPEGDWESKSKIEVVLM